MWTPACDFQRRLTVHDRISTMRAARFLVRGGALASVLVIAACSLLIDTSALTNGGGAGRGSGGGQPLAGATADAGSPDVTGGSPGAGAGAVAGRAGSPEAGGSIGLGGSIEIGGAAGSGGNSGTAGASGGVVTDAGGAGVSSCVPALNEYCDALDNDCDAATPDVCPSGCTGHVYAGKGYMVCNASSTYAQAEALCKSQAMDLVKIDDAAENAFVLSLLKPITLYGYIGGTDAEKAHTFKWPDGTIVWTSGAAVSGVYQNFSSGEPDTLSGTGCLQMTRGASPPAGTWSDTLCAEKQPFVCERY